MQVTSDHLGDYLAQHFQKMWTTSLIMKDLTVASRVPSHGRTKVTYFHSERGRYPFQIFKVHLNNSSNLVLVDFEPPRAAKKIENDMSYEKSWQEICVELLTGAPAYEPKPAIKSNKVLRAFWRRSRELHYVAHFQEPLRIDVGDIGYVSGLERSLILYRKSSILTSHRPVDPTAYVGISRSLQYPAARMRGGLLSVTMPARRGAGKFGPKIGLEIFNLSDFKKTEAS
ncbi:hypothetical protein DFH09DRAFT_1077699 [Mycena vulgaris]|nr:hypothetical protein DFH09DRAFT_1077699 [Mycena vulgaris]